MTAIEEKQNEIGKLLRDIKEKYATSTGIATRSVVKACMDKFEFLSIANITEGSDTGALDTVIQILKNYDPVVGTLEYQEQHTKWNNRQSIINNLEKVFKDNEEAMDIVLEIRDLHITLARICCKNLEQKIQKMIDDFYGCLVFVGKQTVKNQ